ncbi:hypothetical protein LZ30DRAFT_686121 [Colletotrichum cereale]|nr:hypothetical protein LZ30DRAFT_686121 [Colletotrichum cereale]
MDTALWTALSTGLPAVSDFHSNKPKPVDPELASKNALPQNWVPSPKDHISITPEKGEIKTSPSQHSFESGFGRTGLDYVDTYLVHDPINPLRLRDELNNYGIPLVTGRCEFNVLRRYPEVSDNIARCKAAGLIRHPYSSLSQDEHRGDAQGCRKRGMGVGSVALNYNPGQGVMPVVGVRDAQQVVTIDKVSVEGRTTSVWQQDQVRKPTVA